MDKLFSRLLWLPSITDQPVTVGELLSAVPFALALFALVWVALAWAVM